MVRFFLVEFIITMGHHKLKLLTIPFALFIYAIAAISMFSKNGGPIDMSGFALINPIALTFVMLSYYVIKKNQKYLLATFIIALGAFIYNLVSLIRITAGSIEGEKSIAILFLIPFGAFLIYFYYEVFES